MRSRNIKPGFFKNEDLADCEISARLLFIGLWCMADREGRLEYRPKRIKAEIMPYDNCNIEKLLQQLVDKKFILIYSVSTEKYISIFNFGRHQNCHIKEAASTIPAPCEHDTSMEVAHLNPESLLLNPESLLLNPESLLLNTAAPDKSGSKTQQVKIKHLDVVFITETEFQSLNVKYGPENTRKAIEILNNAIMSKGYKYKSHYHTLVGWPMKEAKGDNSNGNSKGFNTNRTSYGTNREISREASDMADAINAEYYAKKAAEANNTKAE